MRLFLNIIVLIFEILYYSLFMKYARKEGSFIRYLISFTLITIIFLFLGTTNFICYFLLILTILFGLKYIVKLKVSLYDMLIIVIMLFCKVLIETPLYIILYKAINIYFIGVLVNIIKIIVIFLIRNVIDYMYKHLKVKWDNNNFYIRYIFSICCFIYCIITAILFIKYSIG